MDLFDWIFCVCVNYNVYVFMIDYGYSFVFKRLVRKVCFWVFFCLWYFMFGIFLDFLYCILLFYDNFKIFL